MTMCQAVNSNKHSLINGCWTYAHTERALTQSNFKVAVWQATKKKKTKTNRGEISAIPMCVWA